MTKIEAIDTELLAMNGDLDDCNDTIDLLRRTPKMSERMPSMRAPVRSMIFCTRLRTVERCLTRSQRWRPSARSSRNGWGGTWEGVQSQSPNWHTQASHTLSVTSDLRLSDCSPATHAPGSPRSQPPPGPQRAPAGRPRSLP